MTALSPMQQRVYDEIERCQKELGYTPTLRALAENLDVSQFTVAVHIKKLIKKERARRINPRHIKLM